MSLSETKNIDLIQVLESGVIQVRYATKIFKDGVEIANSYERELINPGQDLTGQPEQIIGIAQASWTPEIVSAFQTEIDKNLKRIGL